MRDPQRLPQRGPYKHVDVRACVQGRGQLVSDTGSVNPGSTSVCPRGGRPAWEEG